MLYAEVFHAIQGGQAARRSSWPDGELIVWVRSDCWEVRRLRRDTADAKLSAFPCRLSLSPSGAVLHPFQPLDRDRNADDWEIVP